MMRSLVLILFIITFQKINAQQLYKPREIEQAFKKGTRSEDGRPGKNYWQNYARYNISVTASPPDRTIHGEEQIIYINRSPDTLQNLVFKLILNIHKPGAARFNPVTPDYLTTGLHIDSFKVNNVVRLWKESDSFNTVGFARLDHALSQNDSVHMSIKWHFDVSQISTREGMIDSTTFFLAYFYPRVAVYDDYQGWDANEFNDVLEFYNDFNDYTLSVQVPKNYLVWATGTLQNSEAVLQPSYVNKLNQSMISDDIIPIVSKQDLISKNITTQNDMNTWLFKANNITDVALGFSDHYVWDATSVIVDTISGRRASAQVAYKDASIDFHYVARFASDALSWLSRYLPGIPYPYEKTTVFQGFGNMEYPMMVNDNISPDTTMGRRLTTHEISHTFMPFYMGINEARHGFMDEGWATTFDYLLARHYYGDENARNVYKARRITGWIKDPSAEQDLPIITPGTALNGRAIRSNSYGKASLGYLAMLDMLGERTFKKCLHEYIQRWNGKHPIPWDFFNSFNDAAGKNLNWFWNNWFFTNYYIDLAIAKVEKTKSGYSFLINNIGGMYAPFDLLVTYADKNSETFHQTTEIWKENQKQVKVKIQSTKRIQSVEINGGIFMDADETNNKWIAK